MKDSWVLAHLVRRRVELSLTRTLALVFSFMAVFSLATMADRCVFDTTNLNRRAATGDFCHLIVTRKSRLIDPLASATPKPMDLG